jgi:hypothetical protein
MQRALQSEVGQVSMEELEVYITPDGLGRAAIVQRADGLICIYVNWIWAESVQMVSNVQVGGRKSWRDDPTSTDDLYKDATPESGLYGTIEDARRHITKLPEFSNAALNMSD